MIEDHLKEDTSILDEFSPARPQKSRLFDAFTISSLIYIAFFLSDFAVDFKTFSLKNFDWQIAIIILVLPSFGVISHLAGKQIAWIINSFYYLFITLVSFFTFLRSLFGEQAIPIEKNWRGLMLFMLAFIPTVFLFSKPIKKYFKVNSLLLIIIVGISVSLAILMVLAILNKN
jgi:hypothetical protein